MNRGAYSSIGAQSPSSLTWSVCRDGASTTSLGNLCQCLTALTAKNFYIQSKSPLFQFETISPCAPALLDPFPPELKGLQLHLSNQ